MSTGLLSRPAPTSADATTTGAEPARRGSGWWWLGVAFSLLVATLLRIWGAAANAGNGDEYYTAAVLSMSQDWTSFLTGGLDTSHFVSMDKPAPWLWPSAILVNWFGLSWATVFLPGAIAGVLSVWVLALAVREGFGDRPGTKVASVLAAFGLAISPMNVAIDRDNLPDPFLLLALLTAGWLALRAIRRQRLLPLLGAGAMVGLGFDAKLLEAYIVLPALVAVWVLCAAGPIGRRLGGAAGLVGSTLVVSAIWPILVALTPNAPWMAGSNSGGVLSRILNIFSISIAPDEAAPPGPAGMIVNAFLTGEVFHGGQPGKSRLFSGVMADQISWWLPLAILATLTTAIALAGRRRTDPAMAGLVLWAGWALCCFGVFSFMRGTLHPYYTNILVPALAALSATGVVTAWTLWKRGELTGKVMLVAHVLVVAGWSTWVVATTSGQRPGWLAPVVAGAGVLAALAILGLRGRGGVLVGVLTAIAALLAPLTWSVKTTQQPLLGGNPLANQPGRYELAVLPKPLAEAFLAAIQPKADPALVSFLEKNRGDAKWMAATVTAIAASPLIVASDGQPVMAIGGYDGRDEYPSLDRFREFVRAGDVRFVLGPPPGPSTAAFIQGPAKDISDWVMTTCPPVDLATGTTGSAPLGLPEPPPGMMPPGAGAPPGFGGAPPPGMPPGGMPPGGMPPGGFAGPPPGMSMDAMFEAMFGSFKPTNAPPPLLDCRHAG